MNYQILIPARGGSKRFIGKNLYPLGGIPLISHTINYALDSFKCDRIWVNSDDKNILNEAKKSGVNITERPSYLAGDDTPTSEVCNYQFVEFERLGIQCDALIVMQCTSPFRPKGLIENCISVYERKNRDSLVTLSSLKRKIGVIDDDIYYPINYIPGQRSQDIENEYFENGLLYITKYEVVKMKKMYSKNVIPFVIDDTASQIDIDYPEDILFAEFVLSQSISKSKV